MSTPSAIRCHALSFRYSQGTTALTDVQFEIESGECVGLVGPNGAGKTTLFLCLAGVVRPKAEVLTVGELDLKHASHRKRLPAHLGIVFQNSEDQLFNATVFDDVAFGPLNLGLDSDEVRQRVSEALDRVGMAGSEERVPFYLSGGEQRRIALAGVLAMKPEVLLLDEPSLHLDPRGRRALIELLADLEGTKLIASHDLEMVVRLCSRVLLLDGGRVIAQGATRTLLADAELMEKHGLEVPMSLSR